MCFGSEKNTGNITCEYMDIKLFSPAVEAWAISVVQICSEKKKRNINMYKAPDNTNVIAVTEYWLNIKKQTLATVESKVHVHLTA